ncbi:thioester reductase domain-containing protein [Streptomyces sp. FXJ1.172]|uniref:type I polyketide synthase n=1 Tax=Streptomyces sp. FXJ1.172 TaxID=710705 RepID=UPI0023DD5E56|nr:type I polyketide synthase [Streptomyces sp. FXJ1.172]WEO93614.1 thioester reductase domain-containing protein [Streptomyces sp. FXJ1.172]
MNTSVDELVEALRESLKENERLKARITEPIAIIGMSCRFPGGVMSPEDLWELVAADGDAIAPFPTDRGWDTDGLHHPDADHPGTTPVREGGFLRDAAYFDAGFFGITPREAAAINPQQRLLLECAWESFERAGIDPATLVGSRTGVFTGVIYQDYSVPLQSPPHDAEGYLLTGELASVASGRIAYTMGLQGPAITLDTACSSSLVALHAAAESLRRGECSLALAGGATVMCHPRVITEMSRQGALSPDGRSKPFSDSADGAGWGEGAGLLLLERLSDAQANGHRVLAVIRGSAVNSDGASNGLTAPNGPSQQRVIRDALRASGLSPADVDAVEAHGTGTTLGDPIEAGALIAAYGVERPAERPLWVGSVKSNIGHSQAAAGVAGVIKTVMALQHEVLPSLVHFSSPSPHVDWEGSNVVPLAKAVEWPRTQRPRRCGVSSFGISGTNAHVIVEEAPQETSQQTPDDVPQTGGPGGADTAQPSVVPWVVSARSEAALRAQAAGLLTVAQAERPQDVGFSLAVTRSRFDHRAVVLGSTREELTSALASLSRGEPTPHVVRATAWTDPRPVFVFPGQGGQWPGMATALAQSSPVFATSLAECGEALRHHVPWSLEEVLKGTAGAPGLDRVDVVQPVLWAVMVSLAKVWRAYGVEPAAVVGHSQGEIAAACVAGALSLDDAARVVALRSRALVPLLGNGAMLSLGLGAAEARERTARWGTRLSVAAVNGPESVAVSGDAEAVAELQAECEAAGIVARTINVDYASHSGHVEPVRQELLDALAGVRPRTGSVPMISTVTGEPIGHDELDAEYWWRNLRRTVEFETASHHLLTTGHHLFIEISPHPVLAFGLEGTIEAAQADATVIGTLRRDDGGPHRMTTSLAQAHTHGAPVDWNTYFTPARPHRIPLPTYPFQRQRYWLSESPPAGLTDLAAAGLERPAHPLIGAGVQLADTDGHLFTARLSLDSHPWLADHAVGQDVVLPGTAILELALRAGEQVGAEWVDELVLEAPLVLPDDDTVQVQLTVSAVDEEGRRRVSVHSRRGGIGEWVRHATGVVSPSWEPPYDGFAEWPPAGAEPMAVDAVYDLADRAGMSYGPVFRGLKRLWRRGDEFFAESRLPAEIAPDAERYGLHPALADAVLHGCLAAMDGKNALKKEAVLPFTWTGAGLYAFGAAAVRARIRTTGDAEFSVDLADDAGNPVGRIATLAFRPAGPLLRGTAQALSAVRWTSLATPPVDALPDGGLWVLATGGDALGRLFSDADVEFGTCEDAASAARRSGPVLLDVSPTAGIGDTTGDDPGADGRAAAGRLARAAVDDVRQVLSGMREWLAATGDSPARLAVITHRAVGTVPEEDVADLAGAAVWGLVRTAQAEYPGRFVLVDVDDEPSSAKALLPALRTAEEQIAIRGGHLSTPRIGPLRSESAAPPLAGPDRTVLITGGTGGLGGLLARHLAAEHGIRHLVLAGRRGEASPGARELVAELAELGASARIAACDVADYDAVSELLNSIPADRPLGAVIHAAGVLDDGTVETLTDAQIERVMRAKVDGAVNLHLLTRDCELASFIMYSSVAGVLGTPGQANYAAGNALLDALVHHRRARGLPGVSMAWGPWERDTGMTGGLTEADHARLARWGLLPLDAQDGCALFDAARAADSPLAVPCRIQLTRALDAQLIPAMLRDMVRDAPRLRQAKSAVKVDTSAGERERLRAFLTGLPATRRHAELVRIVAQHAAEVANLPSADDVATDLPLMAIGFDSLASLELRNRLVHLLGLTGHLSANAVFQTPTPDGLAARIAAILADEDETPPAPAQEAPQAHVRLADDVVPAADLAPASLAGAQHLFVTGGTGFLGAFVLRELLDRTSATLHCLVNAADADEGAARLRDTMRRYRLRDDDVSDRLVPVPGDLARPLLGLTEDEFDALAKTADGVFHCDTVGDELDVFEDPEPGPANAAATATEDVLRLAARHRTVPVHHVSTLAVFGQPGADGQPLAEDSLTGPSSALSHGHERSMWVAEGLVAIARERGLPVSVYRLSRAFGHHETGACRAEDLLWRVVKGCVQAGAAPMTELAGDIIPVDYAAAAVAALACDGQSLGGTFHLSNPDRVPFASVIAALTARGYPLAELPPGLWAEIVGGDPDNAAYPVLEAFSEIALNPDGRGDLTFESAATRATLASVGVSCPPVTTGTLAATIDYFIETGYLPTPQEASRR